MLQTSPQFQAVPRSLAEVLTVIVKTDPKKGRGLFRRLRTCHSQHVVRYCLQFLGTHELNATSRQMAAWLSTSASYGPCLLDPAFLTIEQAKQAAKIIRATDPQFALKIVRCLHEEPSADVMQRARIILDTTRESVSGPPQKTSDHTIQVQ